MLQVHLLFIITFYKQLKGVINTEKHLNLSFLISTNNC